MGFGSTSEPSLRRHKDKDSYDDNITISHPYYLLAIFGDLDFVEWKLKQDPMLMKHVGNRSLLLACIFYGFVYWNIYWNQDSKIGPQALILVQRLLDMGPLKDAKHILAVLIMWLGRWQSTHHDAFIMSKPFFGPMFAGLLSKIEEQEPTTINFTVTLRTEKPPPTSECKVYWDDEQLGEGVMWYGNWERLPGQQLAKAMGCKSFKVRKAIEFLEFENGEEILGFIDAIEATGSASSATK